MWLWSCLAATTLACSDDPPVRELPDFAQGCETESFEACNVFDADCQIRTFSAVQCLRGNPEASRPAIRSITVQQYADELTGGPAPSDDEIAEANRQQGILEGVLQGLGLAEPGDFSPEEQVELSTSSVPGYYDGAGDRITLIEPEDPEQIDDLSRTSLLAHEFVHALQDQEVDLIQLARNTNGTFDAYLARLGMVEGEATMLESFFALAMLGVTDPVDFRRYFVGWVPQVEEEFTSFSPLRSAPRYVPYSYGARYVFNVFTEGGRSAVTQRLRQPPPSMLPILSSVRGLVEPEVQQLEYMSLVQAPAGMERIAFDRLGPWVVRKLLQRIAPVENWEQLSDRWRGDRFVLYGEPLAPDATEQPFAGVWSVRFDTATSASEFEVAVRSALLDSPTDAPHVALVERAQVDVSIVVSSQPLDASAREDWSARIARALEDPTRQEAGPLSEEPGLSAGPLLVALSRALLPTCLHTHPKR